MRTTDSTSPATEVAITSIAKGFLSAAIVNSKEKCPSALGMARLPLTLTVASGEAIPVTVMISLLTTKSFGGKVTSSCNAAVWGTRVETTGATGSGVGVGLGATLGVLVAVGDGSGVASTVGITVGVLAGIGVSARSGVEVGSVAGVWAAVDGGVPVEAVDVG